MVKKLFLVVFVGVFSFSCSDEIETNTPVIQGSVNNQFFRAKPATASLNPDSSVVMTGTNGSRTITLQTASPEEGQYFLGANPLNKVTFLTFDQELFVAGAAGLGNGMIEITENTGSSLYGAFYFNAIGSDTGDTLNFQKGVFFEVPIVNSNPDEDPETGDFLKADIDGTPFDALIVEAQENGGTITASGSIETTTISFTFPVAITPGDYSLTPGGTYTVNYTVNGTLETGSGNLTITAHDETAKELEGTFEFTTDVSSTVVNNGTFRFTYQ